MRFGAQIKSVITNQRMLQAYLRWAAARALGGRRTHLRLPGGATLGKWVSFSEYWTFQHILPACEARFVERCLDGQSGDGGVAVDVGANIGAFTCFIGSLGHRVHAFEPIPETFCRLKANVRSNGLLGRTTLNCLAVGAEAGMAVFQVHESSPATNRIVHAAAVGTVAASSQLVAVTSLDEYCHHQKVDEISLLKVDVEGMEPLVLRGATGLLRERRINAILIEVCPGNLIAAGFTVADLEREFQAARYLPYALEDDGHPGSRLGPADLQAMSLANIVLLPDESS